jgi:hypothetical protein
MRHHGVRQKDRDEILADSLLRVGQITADDRLPEGAARLLSSGSTRQKSARGRLSR